MIEKKIYVQARAALKVSLMQYEDEPLNHRYGPPAIGSCPGVVPRHQEKEFLESMVKEGILVRHPWGGFMHPRFKDAVIPSKEEVASQITKLMERAK